MVEIIQPRQNFPISRLLTDPTDNNTYYLSAIIRNAKTGATIDTKELSQISGRLYGVTYQMPADPSGQGFYITITTEVYTDSGRTVKSDAYGEEHEVFFLYDRFNFTQQMASQIAALISNDGLDIDYNKIKKACDKAISESGIKTEMLTEDKMKKMMEKKKEGKEKDEMAPMKATLKEIAAATGRIEEKIKEPERLDYQIIKDHVDSAKTEIKEHVTSEKAEKFDDTPLREAIQAANNIETKELLQDAKSLLDSLNSLINGDFSNITNAIAEIKEKMYPFMVEWAKGTRSNGTEERREINRSGNLIIRKS